MAEPAPVLEGRLVRLRPVEATDVAPFLNILREPEAAPWWPPPATEAELGADLLADEEVWFAVEDVADGAFVGVVGYWEEDDPAFHFCGIDITLTSRVHGRGFGTDSLRTLARHLIDERGHHRLTIDPAAANAKAIRAYEAVGFRPVGIMREYERLPDGTLRDCLLMDLLASELRT